MSEQFLIEHCSPTLAGLKSANLFSAEYKGAKRLAGELRRLNRMLGPVGLRVVPVRARRGRVLLYMYRPALLQRDFGDAQASGMLRARGYRGGNAEQLVKEMIGRVRESEEFPHEIGLFLGYPPEDVEGFIRSPQEGCKLTGYWKVYGDVNRAARCFAEYRRCTECYRQSLAAGRCLRDLAVRI
ncbi:DUF3793 family protein [Lachnoclostridium sp. Marseille-P6806]|uniref:DUF3793 family protein n=1 Tax=Lachnoclostridium sp. Marseille-P6806 TaxID=2364793 RepID=UPI00102F5EEC|nr:DUF3793 family protein [Lachnoclostridium sp. Marseille-P6806]